MTILPPLIVHDGSIEAHRLVDVLTILAPDSLEVIDASTKAGLARIAEINRGLRDGTLDTNTPPLMIGVDTEMLKRAGHATGEA